MPQTALFMQDLFARAGFPAGAFQTLLVGSARVEAILRDQRVVAATLTGSGPAGQSVAAIAGSEIKKVVLELGGSDPFVVMPSADLDAAARVAATARLLNNGQSCIAAKRFIVHDEVYDEFERLFTEQMAARTVGDPMDKDTDVGPLASEQQRDDIEKLVADAVALGARVLCGGAAPDRPGFYYPPTVLAGITPDMRVHREEVFGPVATLYRVADLDAAIEIANGTEFGLGANAWTTDEAERDRLIRDLVAGMVFINGNVTTLPAAAVRRGADLGARPGAVQPGHPRVLQHQDSLDRLVEPASDRLTAGRGAGRPGHRPPGHVLRAARRLATRPRRRRGRDRGRLDHDGLR